MEHFLGPFYHLSPAPPRTRTKPMQVIAVGLPRSGTESLQQALLRLGYNHTYHGYGTLTSSSFLSFHTLSQSTTTDLLLDTPSPVPHWRALATKKWFGAPNGDCTISAEEFDVVLGHCTAVTDISAYFAAELITAYPDAKIILNTRRDLDAWHKSIVSTVVPAEKSWGIWLLTLCEAELFWIRVVYHKMLWRGLFRSTGPNGRDGIVRNGKWVYREHCDMVRGLLKRRGEEGRLLEWSVDDGWGSLCEFLGNKVPDEPFPSGNNKVEFDEKLNRVIKKRAMRAARNVGVVVAAMVGVWYAYLKSTNNK